jgi:ABC-2 type transport system permease protein
VSSRFAGLLIKESIQFSRDRVMLALILFLYTAEIVMCTVALSFDVRGLEMAIVDLDRTPASRALAERFWSGPEFVHAATSTGESDAAGLLASGGAAIVLVIPRDFAAELDAGRAPRVQVLLDGTNSNTAAIARGYALKLIAEYERSTATRGAEPARGVVMSALRVWYNQSLAFSSFMVLSMIAVASMLVGVVQPAASIVREKELGTIEQLLVTPITTAELFLAKTVPAMVMCLLALFPALLIAHLFGVPMRGGVGLFVTLTGVFLLNAVGLGVLVASVTRTLQQALLLAFFGLFPLLFLSGTMVPAESMPAVLQAATQLSPLRHYMDILLGIFLKGVGLPVLWPHVAALLGLGAGLFGAAFVMFKRGAGSGA